MSFVRSVLAGVAAITAVLVVTARLASADNIDDLVEKLEDSSDRVRISAVLALTNQESPRSIAGLARTLGKSGEQKNIRGLAATALGRIVANGKPNAQQKKQAIDALTAAKGDSEPFVAAKAEAALELVGANTSAPTTSARGGIYVHIGPMSSKTGGDDKKLRELMKSTSSSTMGRVASSMMTTWPGGKEPTKAQLDAKGVAGFYVDGTLNELKVEKSGGTARISCKVSMLLASFPDKSVFGFLNGGAAVEGSSSERELALAQQDCVQAVVEDLIAKKIVPTIKTKVGP